MLSLLVQASGRRVAYHTFSHVLDLDISFHLERRTGALSRILERGARCSNADLYLAGNLPNYAQRISQEQ